ncbi:ABC transporter permease, partial [Candidatus Aerophobetes bacterium]|nr:ABC transporter permease [Candidatus Aerophobetes bacterium]
MSLSFHSIKVLVKREILASLYGWGFYVAIFISLFVSSFIVKNFLGGIKGDDIFISSYPLNFPLFVSVVIISLYLVIISAVSISREREQGTLEVLFYGPVSSFSFLFGKYLTDMFLYLIILGFFAIYFLGVSFLTNLGFTPALVKAFFLSIFLASCMISFGLFISSVTGRVRSSIVWLIGILLAFLAIWFFQSMLRGIPSEALS